MAGVGKLTLKSLFWEGRERERFPLNTFKQMVFSVSNFKLRKHRRRQNEFFIREISFEIPSISWGQYRFSPTLSIPSSNHWALGSTPDHQAIKSNVVCYYRKLTWDQKPLLASLCCEVQMFICICYDIIYIALHRLVCVRSLSLGGSAVCGGCATFWTVPS